MPTSQRDACLIVFSRAPVSGRVKTRLRPAVGAAGAVRVHKALCEHMLALASQQQEADLELHADPGCGHPWLRAQAKRYGASLRAQGPGDLGQRMVASLRHALRKRPFVVLIGSDCAGLRIATIERAFSALRTGAEMVITPTEDGGYGLIGARAPLQAAVFHTVQWGSDAVLRQTHKNARRLGLDLVSVDRAWDVDHWRDVRRWQRQISQPR